jgi:hypothetical protein
VFIPGPGLQSSPLGTKFTPGRKPHPLGQTNVVKNWPRAIDMNIITIANDASKEEKTLDFPLSRSFVNSKNGNQDATLRTLTF